jgi:hypothetical protein
VLLAVHVLASFTSITLRLITWPISAAIVLTVLAACSSQNWRAYYPAPYNTASSETKAIEWHRREAFRDRKDWVEQPLPPDHLRVYPRRLGRLDLVMPANLADQRGRVVVNYLIETDGMVRDARVMSSTNPKLSELCRQHVLTFRHRPGTMAGNPSIFRYTHTCKLP